MPPRLFRGGGGRGRGLRAAVSDGDRDRHGPSGNLLRDRLQPRLLLVALALGVFLIRQKREDDPRRAGINSKRGRHDEVVERRLAGLQLAQKTILEAVATRSALRTWDLGLGAWGRRRSSGNCRLRLRSKLLNVLNRLNALNRRRARARE